jgi:hypothetical protein
MPPKNPSRPHSQPSPPSAAPPAAAPPPWLRALILAGASVVLLAGFSNAFGDSDGWWHLKTGQYIVQQRRLPVPDPFAFTTAMGAPAYPEEPLIRHFNLTHEWLSQVIFYAAYAAAGFGGVVALRMLLLFSFCALVGLLVYRRTSGFYWAMAASLAAAKVIPLLAVERPHIFTYVLLAVTLLILERGRPLWLLPPLFLFWANCHGGYIMGWVALGGYCARSLWLWWRGQSLAGERRLWLVAACCVLVTGLNPNGFQIFTVLASYRQSAMQSALTEWQPPHYWEFSVYTVLLYSAALCLLWARTRARLVDWLFFAAFALASLSAMRNVFLIALVGPIVVAAYFPWKRAAAWMGQCLLLALLILSYLNAGAAVKLVALVAALGVFSLLAARGRIRIAEIGLAIALASTAYAQATSRGTFRFVAAEEYWPKGAAEFLRAHRIAAPMLNNYHEGGYLIWKLWPQERVFIDGRALNEAVFRDAYRMYLLESGGGRDPARLLDDYGIDVVLMSGFEFVGGIPYPLVPALALLPGTEWKLVYQDHIAVVLMRHLPPGVKPLNPLDVLTSLENQCRFHRQFYPAEQGCATGLVKLFQALGDDARARTWMAR